MNEDEILYECSFCKGYYDWFSVISTSDLSDDALCICRDCEVHYIELVSDQVYEKALVEFEGF